MPTVLHKNVTGADAIHPAAYVQTSDPGNVGANKFWIDTTTVPPALKVRNALDTAWTVFAAGSAGLTGPPGPAGATGATGIITVTGAPPYICIQDQKTSGTNGGTFTSGSFQTRTLTTIVANDLNLAVLDRATSRITLAAGTWRVHVLAPGQAVDRHQARLQNITGSGTLITGKSAFAALAATAETDSVIAGRFTLGAPAVLEVQHRCQTTRATDGFGVPASFGTEVYTVAEFWLEAGPPPFFGSTFDNPSLSGIAKRFVMLGQDQQQHSLNTPPQ